MSDTDARKLVRKSLTLPALLKVGGEPSSTGHLVKVRNLSGAGMMAEGDVAVVPGAHVAIELQELGWVEGTVAWKQENRFGIAFAEEIDESSLLALCN